MIKIENINRVNRRVVSAKIPHQNFSRIVDLCLYGIENRYNLTYDINKDGDWANLRLEVSDNSKYFINIDYYETTNYYDIDFSYKIDNMDFSSCCLRCHSMDIVMGCINQISMLVNRSLND